MVTIKDARRRAVEAVEVARKAKPARSKKPHSGKARPSDPRRQSPGLLTGVSGRRGEGRGPGGEPTQSDPPNPAKHAGGRPPGSQNKLTRAVKEIILAAADVAGARILKAAASPDAPDPEGILEPGEGMLEYVADSLMAERGAGLSLLGKMSGFELKTAGSGKRTLGELVDLSYQLGQEDAEA